MKRKLTIKWVITNEQFVYTFDAPSAIDVPSPMERRLVGRETKVTGMTDSEALHQALIQVDPGDTYVVTFENVVMEES